MYSQLPHFLMATLSHRRLSAIWQVAALILWFGSSLCPAQTLTQRWAKRANEPPINFRRDEGVAVKVGPDRNVVVAGNSYFSSGFSDILVVKYGASTGNVIWQRRTHTATDKNDRVTGLVLDAAGNVIVVGYRQGAYPDPSSLFVAKYAAANGALIWEKIFNSNSSFAAVGVDSQGNVIATGTARLNSSSPIESDIITYKFAAATGEILWKHLLSRVDPTRTSADLANFLTVDASDNVIVTGYGSRTQYEDAVILKINGTNGSLLWNKYYFESGWDGSYVLTLRDTVPIADSPRRFMRLKVTN